MENAILHPKREMGANCRTRDLHQEGEDYSLPYSHFIRILPSFLFLKITSANTSPFLGVLQRSFIFPRKKKRGIVHKRETYEYEVSSYMANVFRLFSLGVCPKMNRTPDRLFDNESLGGNFEPSFNFKGVRYIIRNAFQF